MGGRSIACINARDRNLLGFRRDLLTAAAYGVDQFLLVYGDRPTSGSRTGQLTVQTMMDELRQFSATPAFHTDKTFRAGVTSRLGPLPSWKHAADFLFLQASFSLERLLRWQESVDFAGPVYAGVMVVASAPMARKAQRRHSRDRSPGTLDRRHRARARRRGSPGLRPGPAAPRQRSVRRGPPHSRCPLPRGRCSPRARAEAVGAAWAIRVTDGWHEQGRRRRHVRPHRWPPAGALARL